MQKIFLPKTALALGTFEINASQYSATQAASLAMSEATTVQAKMEATVGVLVPVYNRPAKLLRALRSVARQILLPRQVVVVDDASSISFNDCEIHRMFSDLPGVEVYVHRLKQNVGPSAARQAGLEHLKTDFVAFLDSDDVWRPEKLQLQMLHLKKLGDSAHKVALAAGFRYFDARGFVSDGIMPLATNRLEDLVSGCWYNPGSTVVASRQSLFQVGGFDKRLRRLEDLDLFIRFAKAGGRLDVVNRVCVDIEHAENAASDEVLMAVNVLRAKFACAGADRLPTDVACRLSAWLEIEQAKIARARGDWTGLVRHLAASYLQAPRLQPVQLRRWWLPLADVPAATPPQPIADQSH